MFTISKSSDFLLTQVYSLPHFGMVNGKKVFKKWFLLTAFSSWLSWFQHQHCRPFLIAQIWTTDTSPSSPLLISTTTQWKLQKIRNLAISISNLLCFQNMETGTTGSFWDSSRAVRTEVQQCLWPLHYLSIHSNTCQAALLSVRGISDACACAAEPGQQ